MLEAYNINKEDYEIAIGMKLPYLFKYDSSTKTYTTGAMLQSKASFNLYLNTLGIEMDDTTYSKPQVPQALREMQGMAMLGILLETGAKHAVVFTKWSDNKYVFMNNKRQGGDEPDEYVFDENELCNRIGESVSIARLTPCPPKSVDFASELNDSLATLRKYGEELYEFCSILQPFGEINAARNRLFRPLVLDGLAMMGLVKNQEMSNRLTQLQAAYLAALKKRRALVLKDEMPMGKIICAIDGYADLIAGAGGY